MREERREEEAGPAVLGYFACFRAGLMDLRASFISCFWRALSVTWLGSTRLPVWGVLVGVRFFWPVFLLLRWPPCPP